MKHKITNFITLSFILVSLVWLSGCGFGAKAPEAILIGGTLPESGSFMGEAGAFRPLMNAWADMINEDGGLYVEEYQKKIPIRFIIYNDESDQDKVRELYEKLVTEDKVHLLIGPFGSPLTFPASAVAEKHQVPFLGVEANSDAIYSRNFHWLVGVVDTGRKWSYNYLEMMKAKTDAQSIAFVVQDGLHTKEVYEGTRARAEELGFTVVFEEIYPADTEDFSPAIARLKDVEADIVFVSSFNTFAAKFIKQADDAGLNPKALHSAHHGGSFLQDLETEAELVTGEHYWASGISGEGIDEFEELLRRSGLTAEEYPWAAIRMPAFQVLRAAIENAGSLEREKLMQALKGVDIMTISGRLTFAENGAGSMNPFPTQIQNGQYIAVWPEAIAGGEYQYPRSEYVSKK